MLSASAPELSHRKHHPEADYNSFLLVLTNPPLLLVPVTPFFASQCQRRPRNTSVALLSARYLSLADNLMWTASRLPRERVEVRSLPNQLRKREEESSGAAAEKGPSIPASVDEAARPVGLDVAPFRSCSLRLVITSITPLILATLETEPEAAAAAPVEHRQAKDLKDGSAVINGGTDNDASLRLVSPPFTSRGRSNPSGAGRAHPANDEGRNAPKARARDAHVHAPDRASAPRFQVIETPNGPRLVPISAVAGTAAGDDARGASTQAIGDDAVACHAAAAAGEESQSGSEAEDADQVDTDLFMFDDFFNNQFVGLHMRPNYKRSPGACRQASCTRGLARSSSAGKKTTGPSGRSGTRRM